MALDDKKLVTINGRPIKDLSSSEKVQLALQVQKKLTGPLMVLGVDDLEKFDVEHQRELFQMARNDGFQWFVTRVGEGELKVMEWNEDNAAGTE
jgi:recombinational DNA repair ATPase RecF